MKKERVGGVAEMARTLAGGRSTQTVQNSTRVRGGPIFTRTLFMDGVSLWTHQRSTKRCSGNHFFHDTFHKKEIEF